MTKEQFKDKFAQLRVEVEEMEKDTKPLLKRLKALGKKADKMSMLMMENPDFTDHPDAIDLCLMFRLEEYGRLIDTAIREIEAGTWNLKKSTTKKAIWRGDKNYKDPFPMPSDITEKPKKKVKVKKHLHADDEDDD